MAEHLFVPLIQEMGGAGSYAMLSTDMNTNTAVVFVHGFFGDPVTTWLDFPRMMDQWSGSPWWDTCDAYFFRYGSIHNSTATTADDLANELRKIFPRPAARFFRIAKRGLPRDLEILFTAADIEDVRPGPYQYEHLVLAGHSEGGFVLRRLALQVLKDFGPQDALLQAKLRLFAPALFGAAPSGLPGFLYETFGLRTLARMFLGASVAYQELRSGSGILQSVREQTEKYGEDDASPVALRALVLWGKNDEILLQGEYEHDKRYKRLDGHNHSSICKPTTAFLTPLEFVSA